MFLPTFSMFVEFDKKMRMDRIFWNNMVNSNRSNSPPLSEKKFWRLFYSEVVVHAAAVFFYNRADQPEQEKSNMHAACARHSWIDSLLAFRVFLCGKGN